MFEIETVDFLKTHTETAGLKWPAVFCLDAVVTDYISENIEI